MASQCQYSPSCITGLPSQNLRGPKGTKVALGPTGWPTLGHYGINVGCPIGWAAHREPAVIPKLWASPGQARTGPV